MATHSYNTNARQEAILTAAAARAGLTVGAYVQQLITSALESVLETVKRQSRDEAVAAFQVALDAGQDLRVRFDATTGIVSTQLQARS